MTTDEQVLSQRLDLEMLERPHLWPTTRRGMVCIFVKRGVGHLGASHTGPCFRLEDGSYLVVEHDWRNEAKQTVCRYDSAKAVYDDGWRLD